MVLHKINLPAKSEGDLSEVNEATSTDNMSSQQSSLKRKRVWPAGDTNGVEKGREVLTEENNEEGDIWGTIDNENDSSDEEGPTNKGEEDADAEDKNEEDDDSEELSFEEDSDSEVEAQETYGKESGVINDQSTEDRSVCKFVKRDLKVKTKKAESTFEKNAEYVEQVPSTSSADNGGNSGGLLRLVKGKKNIPQSKEMRTTPRNPALKMAEEISKEASDTFRSNDNEYHTDTSDEEDIRNTVGNIPMNWYDDYPHLGYDWDGKKILKPPRGDELDNFLRKMEDPNFWRTVKDPQTGQDVVLCDADVDLIERLQKQKIPDPQFDEYAPWIEWFSSEVMQTPLRKFPEHKRSFIPSKDEARKVGKIVHAIKMGWIKPKQPKPKEPQFYMLWSTDDTAEHMRRIHDHIPAPKRHLPGHVESYNPPPEYLFDKRELKEWKKLEETPWKRKVHFIPQKYSSLREVPAYHRYVKERFLRCLDLYLCPRARKMRLTIQPEDLVPQLPSPKDLQPFPTTQAVIYQGHTDMVRTITVEPKGQYLASGSDDMTVKIWEVSTGRCVRTIPAGGIVRSVSWCPNSALSLLAIAADRKLLIVNPGVGDLLVVKKTDALLQEEPEQDALVSERVKAVVNWEQAAGTEWQKGIRIIVNHFKEIRQVTWHGRGDYFASVMPEGQNRSVVIHQISKRRSQIPFNRAKGLVQCVLFHPIRPIFFVATQRNIRVYDLVKQEIVKKLTSSAKWISSMAVHPAGDNVLVGTYDRKALWYDLDLSTEPYQTLRLHELAIRGVTYHKRYPLFATGSDDNSVIVSHGMVYNDLLQNPLIVPLKKLRYHEQTQDFSVFEVEFHPSQPWLFSSGADGTVRLYT